MVRCLNDALQRQLVLRRAPDLAMTGKYQNAVGVAKELQKEGIEVRLFFSPDTCAWLDELCMRARNEQTPEGT